MRLHPQIPRPALALGLALGLAALATAARAQAPAQAKGPSGPPIPLAHYVPAGDLVAYIEFEGLDAHGDAWRKSALYQVLNTTPAGAMLEDVVEQLAEQLSAKSGTRLASGKEYVALLEHVARNGFVFAAGAKPDDPKSAFTVLALRGVFKNKELKPVVGRMLGAMVDPKVKPKLADVGGHKIVVAKDKGGRQSFGYWVEDSRKEDLVMIPPGPPDEATVVGVAGHIFAVLDGQKPDAATDATRQSLAKEEEGFVPVGFGFVSLVSLPPQSLPPGLGLQDLKGFDFRWGFQDKETVSIVRIAAPKPREGMLAIFDQPTFDKGGLPPVPEGVGGFTVFSINLLKTYDQLTALATAAKPEAAGAIEGFAEQVQAKTKLRLKEDILAHLGPKVAVYVAPSPKATDATKAAPPNPMVAMVLAPLGMQEVPRLTLVAEIDDPKAVGRTLDSLMIAANQGLRGLAPMLAAVAPPEPNANNGPGAGPYGPGAGPGGRAQGKAAARGITLEFKQVGTGVYTMTMPSALTAIVPSYVRPTIRIGPKHVVISVSPEAARAALEVKGGGAPASAFAGTLQAVPGDLLFLQVDDSTQSIADGLATFPTKLQELADKAAAPPMPPGLGAAGGPQGANPDMAARMSGGASMPGGPASRSMPMPPGGSASRSMPMPSGPPGSGRPGGSGGPGQGQGQAAAESKGLFTLRVDPSKVPTAAAIKPLLSPSVMAVSVDEEGIKFIHRESFPDLPGMISGNGPSGLMMKQRMAEATAASKAAGAAGAAPEAQPGGPGRPGGPPGMMPGGPGGPGRPGGSGPPRAGRPGA